jgi:hypothetical protein
LEDFLITTKPTYEELEKKVKEFENDSEKFKHSNEISHSIR